MTDDAAREPSAPAWRRTETWLAAHDLVGMRLSEAHELAAERGILIRELTPTGNPMAADLALVGYRINVLCDRPPLVGDDGIDGDDPAALITEVLGIG